MSRIHQTSSSSSLTMKSRSPTPTGHGPDSYSIPEDPEDPVLAKGPGGHHGNATGTPPLPLLSASASYELPSTASEMFHPYGDSHDSLGNVKSSEHVRPRSTARVSVPKGPRTSTRNSLYAEALSGVFDQRTSIVSVATLHAEVGDESSTGLIATSDFPQPIAPLDPQSRAGPREFHNTPRTRRHSWQPIRSLPRPPSFQSTSHVPPPPPLATEYLGSGASSKHSPSYPRFSSTGSDEATRTFTPHAGQRGRPIGASTRTIDPSFATVASVFPPQSRLPSAATYPKISCNDDASPNVGPSQNYRSATAAVLPTETHVDVQDRPYSRQTNGTDQGPSNAPGPAFTPRAGSSYRTSTYTVQSNPVEHPPETLYEAHSSSRSSSSARTVVPNHASANTSSLSSTHTITPRQAGYIDVEMKATPSPSHASSSATTGTSTPRQSLLGAPGVSAMGLHIASSSYQLNPTPRHSDVNRRAARGVEAEPTATIKLHSNALHRSTSQLQPQASPSPRSSSRRWSLLENGSSVRQSARAQSSIQPSVSPVPEYHETIPSRTETDGSGRDGYSVPYSPRRLEPFRQELRPQRRKDSEMPPPNGPFRRLSLVRSQSEAPPAAKKHKEKWTFEEIQMLAEGFREWGIGNWESIAKDSKFNPSGRTATDLEERFRKSFPDTYKEHYISTKTSFFDKVKSSIPSLKKLVSRRKKSLSSEREHDDLTPRQHKPVRTSVNERIRQVAGNALEREEYSGILSLPDNEALLALNLVQRMLESKSSESLNVDTDAIVRYPRSQLIRLVLDLSLKCQQVPSALFLRGVKRTDKESCAAGGFADIYRGTWDNEDIAIKCLRIFILTAESQKIRLRQAFYRESILWHNLQHRHVLPFYGVTADVFPHTLCMVLPWMENGNIRQHIDRLRLTGELVNQAFVNSVNKWLYEIGLGLAYLHSEEVVHGDLRGANILIDHDGCVRLADFGLAVTAQRTGSDYGKVFTHGGATRWQAPELVDPERFGSWSDLPTYKSDVYAFGSVCLELYMCQSPFPGLSDLQVYSMVLTGRRPERPAANGGETMSNAMWNLANWCWSDNPTVRPTAEQALEGLMAATGGVISPQPESPYPRHPSPAPLEQLLVILRLDGVQRTGRGDSPIAGGRSADIFTGKYRGQRVALRRFRMFFLTKDERKLHELLYSSAVKWKELQHKHVLPFIGIDVSAFERGMSMVFPWKNHGNVRNFITKLRDANMFGNGASWLMRWITQLARGLAYLHSEGVVHGALRGTNVLIDDEWGIRLADYDQAGILLQLGENTSSRAEDAHRVLRWMPPEIGDGAHITLTTDIYGFACLCLELYTCKDPFAEVSSETRFVQSLAAGTLRPVRPDVHDGAFMSIPVPLWDLMGLCWNRDPTQRPTAAQLLQLLN